MPYPYRYLRLISPAYRAVRRAFRRRRYAGANVYCVVCDCSFSSWLYGNKYGACPNCGSGPQHRFIWSVLKREWHERTNPVELLHVAPEYCLALRFRSSPKVARYITLDRGAPRVDVRADLTASGLPARSFDAVICSHVLEHIPDDVAAMREMFRILKDDGVAYISVPCQQECPTTDEDFTVTSPVERERRFGQFDHVRVYGRDILERLKGSGFDVTEIRPADILDSRAILTGGHWNDIIFRCKRPPSTRDA
jgi:SAM-dependent methyltransferase